MKTYSLQNCNKEDGPVVLSKSKGKKIRFKETFANRTPLDEISGLVELFPESTPQPINKEKSIKQEHVQSTNRFLQNLQLPGLILLLIISLSVVVLMLINTFQGKESYVGQKLNLTETENSHSTVLKAD